MPYCMSNVAERVQECEHMRGVFVMVIVFLQSRTMIAESNIYRLDIESMGSTRFRNPRAQVLYTVYVYVHLMELVPLHMLWSTLQK